MDDAENFREQDTTFAFDFIDGIDLKRCDAELIDQYKKLAQVHRSSREHNGQIVDFHQKTYVCIHVFENKKPVLLVSRPDADWCFLCGDEHPDDASYYRVVGLGHVLERDASLKEVLDLAPDEEAERTAFGSSWIRIRLSNPD